MWEFESDQDEKHIIIRMFHSILKIMIIGIITWVFNDMKQYFFLILHRIIIFKKILFNLNINYLRRKYQQRWISF